MQRRDAVLVYVGTVLASLFLRRAGLIEGPRINLLSFKMLVSFVVAVSQNNVIGKCQQIPWRLPADLAAFKKTTINHHILMGRKTWDSIGRPLPDRVSIVVTSHEKLGAAEEGKNLKLVHSVDEGIDYAKIHGEKELMVIGGAEIYAQALLKANKMYFTRVHATIDGADTFFPLVDWSQWKLTNTEEHKKDSNNEYDFTIETYERQEVSK